MTSKKAVVAIDEFDARSIALCVQTASSFKSTVHLADNDKKLNAKSIMGLMAMGLAMGDEVSVVSEGPDEEEACEAILKFLEAR